MRALFLLGLFVVLGVVLMSLLTRRARPDPKVVRAANIRFSVGAALLVVAFALSVAEAGRFVIGAAYIGGFALLVNGYLQGRFAHRRRR